MDRRQIVLKLTLDALGLDLKLESFNDRLIIQKAIYLAQVAGIQLGYRFSWYIHGPYSAALTRDAFTIASEEDESRGWSLDDRSAARLRTLRDLIPREAPARRARALECLASVHYGAKRKSLGADNAPAIVEELKALGKDFDGQAVQDALKTLKEFNILGDSASQ